MPLYTPEQAKIAWEKHLQQQRAKAMAAADAHRETLAWLASPCPRWPDGELVAPSDVRIFSAAHRAALAEIEIYLA